MNYIDNSHGGYALSILTTENNMNDDKAFYTVTEMAIKHKVTPRTIYNWIEAGMNHSCRHEGRRTYKTVTDDDVDCFLQAERERAAKDFE